MFFFLNTSVQCLNTEHYVLSWQTKRAPSRLTEIHSLCLYHICSWIQIYTRFPCSACMIACLYNKKILYFRQLNLKFTNFKLYKVFLIKIYYYYNNIYHLYIYIKPKLLELPHFSTSALFKKIKLLKKKICFPDPFLKTYFCLLKPFSDPITISPKTNPIKPISQSLSLPQTQTYLSLSIPPLLFYLWLCYPRQILFYKKNRTVASKKKRRTAKRRDRDSNLILRVLHHSL